MTEPSYPETSAFVDLLQAQGADPRAVQTFCRLYHRYRQGDVGKLDWSEVKEPGQGDLVPYEEIADEQMLRRGCELLDELVVISLNGGLGTTMKLQRAKSLIPVREGQSFLSLTAQQVLALRQAHGARVPWLLMNSFRTRQDTLAALQPHDLATEGLPLDFLQNKFPRIRRDTHLPLALQDEQESWAPPGHGDVYLSLWQSGLLQELRSRGVRWAFVSNIDNLGSTVDPRILAFMQQRDLQFVMEVTDKTAADLKGGTLVRYRGNLMLLETLQVPEAHLEEYYDLSRFKVFNTNNLWWNLDAMLACLEAGRLDPPMIVNPKTVRGVEVVQLETAMGAAIGSFQRAVGLRVPRTRFAPVKATCDLLAVRSDAFMLDRTWGIRPGPARDPSLGPPVITLDDRFYKGLDELEARIPHPLSLVGCRSLEVKGDVRFGKDVQVQGDVVLRHEGPGFGQVPDGMVMKDGIYVV